MREIYNLENAVKLSILGMVLVMSCAAAQSKPAGPWRIEVSRITPFGGVVTTYWRGVLPELRCTAGRQCAGTTTGTSSVGSKRKLGLRLTRTKVTGEWSFRISVSDEPLTAMSAAAQTVRVSLCPFDGAQCLVADWPFALQGTRALRYRP